MFQIFKRNKKVEPIFSVLGTDMHCHLIPAVDDGSKNYDESLACIEKMREVGYKKIYVTPHFQSPRFMNKEDDIEQRFDVLKQRVKEAGIDIELVGVAGEYRIDDAFVKRIDDAKFLKIGGKYVLVELSLHQRRLGVEETIFDLQMKGYEVILAHPERYVYLGVTSPTLAKLKDQGVLFQANILSLSGFYGDIAYKTGMDLVKRGWIDLLGTDMHNMIYAHALEDATRNKQVRKILDKCEFMNSQM